MKPSFLLLLFTFWFTVTAARADYEPRIADPAAYRSPSGAYELEAIASTLFGEGESEFRLTTGGKEVWTKKFSLSYLEAGVADDGTVALVGYTDRPGSGIKINTMDVRMLIFGPGGETRLDERIPRELPGFPGPSLQPQIDGIFLHFHAGLLVVRLTDYRVRGAHLAQAYELATGKKAEAPDLGKAPGWISAAEALPGRPLILVHSVLFQETKTTRSYGAVFSLLTSDGKLVWEKRRPGVYSLPLAAKYHYPLGKFGTESREILSTKPGGVFELCFPNEKKFVQFTVTARGKGWEVKQTGTRPFFPPWEDEGPPATAVKLTSLGEFHFGEPPSHPVRDIGPWAIDGKGRIGFIRQSPGAQAFVLVDSEGTVVADIPLKLASYGTVHLAWAGGARWIATWTDEEKKHPAKAWQIDAEKKKCTPLASFDSPPVASLTGLPDGSFVVVADDYSKHLDRWLTCHDKTGRRRWRASEETLEHRIFLGSALLSVTKSGELILLEYIHHALRFFNAKGKAVREIELEPLWGWTLKGAKDFITDHQGGFLIYVPDISPPFVWTNPDGAMRERFAPRHADGRPVAPFGVRIAPDGARWCSDGSALYRLNAEWKVVQTLGVDFDPEKLRSLASVAGDGGQRLHALDADTYSLHVFDGQGRPVRISKPLPDDFAPGSSLEITLAADGSAYLSDGRFIGGKRVLFGADGQREGLKPDLKLEEYSSERWLPRDGRHNTLIEGSAALYLVDDAGKLQRTMDRQADRQWLEYISSAAVGPEGTFAALHEKGDFGALFITFFSTAGDALKTLPATRQSKTLVGMNNTQVVTAGRDGIVLIDRTSGKAQRLVPKAEPGDWQALLMHQGQELWVVEFSTRKVTRYAMPEAK